MKSSPIDFPPHGPPVKHILYNGAFLYMLIWVKFRIFETVFGIFHFHIARFLKNKKIINKYLNFAHFINFKILKILKKRIFVEF